MLFVVLELKTFVLSGVVPAQNLVPLMARARGIVSLVIPLVAKKMPIAMILTAAQRKSVQIIGANTLQWKTATA
jgi:hypothetical protein